jgi:hypothetical protein
MKQTGLTLCPSHHINLFGHRPNDISCILRSHYYDCDHTIEKLYNRETLFFRYELYHYIDKTVHSNEIIYFPFLIIICSALMPKPIFDHERNYRLRGKIEKCSRIIPRSVSDYSFSSKCRSRLSGTEVVMLLQFIFVLLVRIEEAVLGVVGKSVWSVYYKHCAAR